MSNLHAAADRRIEIHVLIAFIDAMGFALQSTRVADDEIADVIDGYYQLIAEQMSAAGGRVVKFIGDGALVVFDATDTDRGICALLDLKLEADRYFDGHGWDCRASIKAHVGTAIAGPYGRPTIAGST